MQGRGRPSTKCCLPVKSFMYQYRVCIRLAYDFLPHSRQTAAFDTPRGTAEILQALDRWGWQQGVVSCLGASTKLQLSSLYFQSASTSRRVYYRWIP